MPQLKDWGIFLFNTRVVVSVFTDNRTPLVSEDTDNNIVE